MPALQPDAEVVVALRVVAIERGRVVLVGVQQQNVRVAVVVEVRAHHAASLLGVIKAETHGTVPETALAVGYECPRLVPGEAAELVELGPAVGVVDVEIAVVLEIDEAASPAPAAVRDIRHLGGVDENTVVVAIEAVADPRHVSRHVLADGENAADEPVQVAVAVVVADGRAHAVAVDDDLVVRHVAKGAVAVVEEHLGEVEVADHQQVWIRVVVDPREGGREGRVECALADAWIAIQYHGWRDAGLHADA